MTPSPAPANGRPAGLSRLYSIRKCWYPAALAPLHLAFPAALAARWMPWLFPEMFS
jgi:hypothetical protein